MDANTHDIRRDRFMLAGDFARCGFDRWRHTFFGQSVKTGAMRAFFVEAFCINPALAQIEPVFGQVSSDDEDAEKPSYVMVRAGSFGEDGCRLSRCFAWSEVEVCTGAPFCLCADDCVVSETDLIGRIEVSAEEAAAFPAGESDAGSMLWDLRLDKQIAFNAGLRTSTAVRRTHAHSLFWHVEGLRTAVEGTVVLNGEAYAVHPRTCLGYADKNWGRSLAVPWILLQSSSLKSLESGTVLEDSVFAFSSANSKIGPLALRNNMHGAFVYEGRTFEFNGGKPWTGARAKVNCGEVEDDIVWHLELETFDALVICDITCPAAQMLGLNYDAPQGGRAFERLLCGACGWGRVKLFEKQRGELELIDDMKAQFVGCEYGD